MVIERINAYDDPRFAADALRQHGCYLVDGSPCEVHIIAEDAARITRANPAQYAALIEAFRFHAPHITRFVDSEDHLLQAFPARDVLTIPLSAIQPSQFFVDEEKLAAVRSFIHRAEDVIIQVLPHQGRYIALDGHTRLYLAVQYGWKHVRAVVESADSSIFDFVEEARRRGIRQAAVMTLLPHAEYTVRWDGFCDDFFANKE